MSVIALQFLGRFGNCMFSYAFARAYAEKHGLELQTDPWIGQHIFGLKDPPITATNLTPRNENDLVDGEKDIIFRSYCQQQKCLIYTRSDCRRWFQLTSEMSEKLKVLDQLVTNPVGHRRAGDYQGYGYPVCSESSYHRAAKLWLGIDRIDMCQEETAWKLDGVPEFLPDFYRCMIAPVLFRGNSTFSWWAATLSVHGSPVYAPVVEGLEGGKEHHVAFVHGNWPRFANLEFTTDLHLKP